MWLSLELGYDLFMRDFLKLARKTLIMEKKPSIQELSMFFTRDVRLTRTWLLEFYILVRNL